MVTVRNSFRDLSLNMESYTVTQNFPSKNTPFLETSDFHLLSIPVPQKFLKLIMSEESI